MNEQSKFDSGEIMVVDDISANLKLLMSILSGQGYKVRPASNGEQALSAVAKREPDLILLDINMPGIDGYEVCRRLKSNQETCDIPVIFISALSDIEERVKGFEVGGVDFITKPFQPEEIIVRVHSHLQLRRMQEGLESLVQKRTSELVSVNERLYQSEEKYRRIVESLVDEYFFYSQDVNRAFTYVSPSIKHVLGYEPDEFLSHFSEFITDNPINQKAYEHTQASIRGEQQPAYEVEIYNKDRNICMLQIKESPIFDTHGNVIAIEGLAHDVTLRKQAEEKLAYMAKHDPLTQLPNRVLFQSRLEQAIQHAATQNHKVAVLFLDLDRFKDVNDTFGHPFGDRLLKQVATRLLQSTEGKPFEDELSNTVTTLARLGGDEFVLLFQFKQHDEVEQLAVSILACMDQPFSIDGHDLFLGMSIGISSYPDDGDDVATLIRNSDSAMYQAKEHGRNTYMLYTNALTKAAAERVALKAELRHAMEHNEFQVYYQPKVDLASGLIIGSEALIRWNHPMQGLVSPGKFIPLAESSSLILALGEWVLREACHQYQKWIQEGHPVGHVSVNLSGVQIKRGNLPTLVSEVLKQENLAARHLDLEITESVLMTDPEEVIKVLNALRALGTKLSVDDFGTGYSSLAYIKQFPINNLKIDRSFVTDAPKNQDDKAIATAIVALGTSLNLSVTAEGVENEEQRNFLLQLGCNYAQGYLYSRPLPAEEFIQLVIKQSEA